MPRRRADAAVPGRSRRRDDVPDPERHLGLKRNFQLMPGADWLALLCKHIPDRYEQLVRYCGWYSSRSRGERKAKGGAAPPPGGVAEVPSEYASRAKAAWAQLVRKVYEADPLECPKCP